MQGLSLLTIMVPVDRILTVPWPGSSFGSCWWKLSSYCSVDLIVIVVWKVPGKSHQGHVSLRDLECKLFLKAVSSLDSSLPEASHCSYCKSIPNGGNNSCNTSTVRCQLLTVAFFMLKCLPSCSIKIEISCLFFFKSVGIFLQSCSSFMLATVGCYVGEKARNSYRTVGCSKPGIDKFKAAGCPFVNAPLWSSQAACCYPIKPIKHCWLPSPTAVIRNKFDGKSKAGRRGSYGEVSSGRDQQRGMVGARAVSSYALLISYAAVRQFQMLCGLDLVYGPQLCQPVLCNCIKHSRAVWLDFELGLGSPELYS